eukprot:TRINITY_DN61195_c0_g1_i1.p1 TRINITY_DN61195_c0_g1~~TRINITY_DN61195_c0_g1_i1.p1  ORF type:complete len:678 (-),score=201.37 TRINITY_DN61195_c0_g1_i1:92-2125(-)
MQLRKVVNHPYLMPGAEEGPPFVTNDKIYKTSGKMVLLDKLLTKLYNDPNPPGGPHKVLVFCQMTAMLDIMEDYIINFTPYKYCRIDGNTTNADRDAQMAMFNNPKSEHFLFLLSTRAGGLGINLQAANNVILYDSDWNPQMDLQAQDRAHRIGQKRSVRIYRFITDGTVEERVYRRALKKLYLDAMVVQQGRIKSAAGGTAASREELLSMIRFGAEEIFKSRTQDITDADIDALLEQGEKQMETLQNEAKKETQASLASFKLGADETSLYDFEGVDYTVDNDKVSSKLIHITLDEQLSQDEITAACAVYGEVIRTVLHPNMKEALVSFRSQEGATDALKNLKMKAVFATRRNEQIVTSEMIEECLVQPGTEKLGRGHRRATFYAAQEEKHHNTLDSGKSSVKLPRKPTYPGYQLFNIKRLTAIYEAECECIIRNHKRRHKIQDGEAEAEKLSAAELEERENLIAEGFVNWTNSDFRSFVQAVTFEGIHIRDYSAISTYMTTKSAGEVKDYVAAFLEKGQWCIPTYTHIERRIQKAEAKRLSAESIKKALQWKVEGCDNLEELTLPLKTRDPECDRQIFLESYNNDLTHNVAGVVRNHPRNRFDIFTRTRTDDFYAKRVAMLQSFTKREYEKAMGIHEVHTKRSRKDDNLSLIHISEPTRLLSISYAVFCLKKKKKK